MPRRFCTCEGCATCAPGGHNVTFAASESPAGKCPACETVARRTRDLRRDRPSSDARGYDATYRRQRPGIVAAATECHWCHGPFTPDNPCVVDHVQPLSKGGTNDPSNLVPACKRCNDRRGGETRWPGSAR